MNYCPCNDCLCVPTCRHKKWMHLRNECSKIDQYIRDYYVTPEEAIYDVIAGILKPTKWHANAMKRFSYLIENGREKETD